MRAINQLHHDERGRPFRNCRIKSVAVLDDPFPDPPGLDKLVPALSPTLSSLDDRPDADEKDPLAGLPEEEVHRIRAAAAAKSRAVVLEMIGDLPDVDVAPPDNVLFVCKLNPATVDEDLELIFSRFGVVKKAEVIRDHKTGDSLNYAFIEFEQREACEQVRQPHDANSEAMLVTCTQAYEKMNNVIIDDRRIRCDFSQSVMKEWKQCVAAPTCRNNSAPTSPLRAPLDASTSTGTACSCARRRLRRVRSAREVSTSAADCSSRVTAAAAPSTRCWLVMNLGRRQARVLLGLLLQAEGDQEVEIGLVEIEKAADMIAEGGRATGGESGEGREAAAGKGTEIGGGIRTVIGADDAPATI